MQRPTASLASSPTPTPTPTLNFSDLDLNLTQGDLVVVYWLDTEDCSGWENVKLIGAYRPPPAKHVGWFLDEDEECIRILPAIVGADEDNLDAGRSVIPRCSIKHIEKIRDDELAVIVPDEGEKGKRGIYASRMGNDG